MAARHYAAGSLVSHFNGQDKWDPFPLVPNFLADHVRNLENENVHPSRLGFAHVKKKVFNLDFLIFLIF
jgi:hypothetical protein